MDAVVGVLNKLGMDGTVFYQFAIFCAIYFISVPLFIKKLQEVIEKRDANTTLLRDHSMKELESCKELEEEYRKKLEEAQRALQQTYHQGKVEVLQNEKAKIKDVEDQLDQKIESEKKQFVEELDQKKVQLLGETKELAGQLIQRLS